MRTVFDMLQEPGPISDDKRREMSVLLQANGLDALGSKELAIEKSAVLFFSTLRSVLNVYWNGTVTAYDSMRMSFNPCLRCVLC